MRMDRATRTSLRLQNFVGGLLAAVILGLLAYGSHVYQVRWDWTANQRNTLEELSLKAIKGFDEGLSLTVYVQEKGEQRLQAEELLEKYQAANGKPRLRYVDPDLDPAAARGDEVTTYGTVVLRHGERHERITELSEEALTNALIRLSKGARKTVRFVSGHGEHPLKGNERGAYSTVEKLLKGEGYDAAPINLAEVEGVPEGTAALVMAGPRSALLPLEVERLGKWLDQGGRLLLMVDPDVKSGLEELLGKRFGVTFLEGIVLDPVARLVGGSATTPLVTEYSSQHPITREMTQASFFPEARGLKLEEKFEAKGAERVTLLAGAERGWLETSSLASGKAEFGPGDIKGPVLLGAAVQSDKVRLLAMGDSDFASDAYIGMVGNTDLFLNMVRWLAEDENFIAIKPRKITDAGLTLPRNAALTLSWGLVVVVPLLLIGTGFVIWMRRKRR